MSSPVPISLETDPTVEVHLCIPEDQAKYLPRRRRVPRLWPGSAPLPRQGEVIYLSNTSAWGVSMVLHEWKTETLLRIELWLAHVKTSHNRPSGFSLTQ